jgi:hypothetical protein
MAKKNKKEKAQKQDRSNRFDMSRMPHYRYLRDTGFPMTVDIWASCRGLCNLLKTGKTYDEMVKG